MCLAQPLNAFTTFHWNELDTKQKVENLMEACFDEKEKWDEGAYIQWLDELKFVWEECEEGLNMTNEMINRHYDKWHSPAKGWCVPNKQTFGVWTYFTMVEDSTNRFLMKNSGKMMNQAIHTYQIKCATRYNTRKFIKKRNKILGMGMLETTTLKMFECILDLQGLTCLATSNTNELVFCVPAAHDGREYIWKKISELDVWDMHLVE